MVQGRNFYLVAARDHSSRTTTRRASAASFHAVRGTKVVLVTVALALLLTGARCTGREFDDALKAAQKVENAGSVKELEDGGRKLRDLDRASLSASQAQQRQQVLSALDRQLDARIGSELAHATAAADQQIPALAAQTAASAPVSNPRSDFLADLRAETADQIKAAACDTLLNAVAPDQTPDPDHEGAEKCPAAAIRHLSVKWRLPVQLQAVLAWAEWTQGVVKDGKQVQAAVEADPQAYLPYFTRPQVVRGTVAYTKYCYARPGR